MTATGELLQVCSQLSVCNKTLKTLSQNKSKWSEYVKWRILKMAVCNCCLAVWLTSSSSWLTSSAFWDWSCPQCRVREILGNSVTLVESRAGRLGVELLSTQSVTCPQSLTRNRASGAGGSHAEQHPGSSRVEASASSNECLSFTHPHPPFEPWLLPCKVQASLKTHPTQLVSQDSLASCLAC